MLKLESLINYFESKSLIIQTMSVTAVTVGIILAIVFWCHKKNKMHIFYRFLYVIALIEAIAIAFLTLLGILLVSTYIPENGGELYCWFIAIIFLGYILVYFIVKYLYDLVVKFSIDKTSSTPIRKFIQPEIFKATTYGILFFLYIQNKISTFSQASSFECKQVDKSKSGEFLCYTTAPSIETIVLEAFLTFVIIDTIFTILKIYWDKVSNEKNEEYIWVKVRVYKEKIKNIFRKKQVTPDHIESSTEIVEPNESSTEIVEPSESSTEIVEPNESSTEIVEPNESSTEIVEPNESSTEIVEPSESSTEIVEPSESSTEIVEPSESSTEIVEPPNKQKNITKAVAVTVVGGLLVGTLIKVTPSILKKKK